jgi:hypothetical protein
MEDPSQQVSKKIFKCKAAVDRMEYQTLLCNARKFLRNPETQEVQGKVQVLDSDVQLTHGTEIELLQGLGKMSCHLMAKSTLARISKKKNAQRNYRRKRQQVKKLQAQLRARIGEGFVSPKDCSKGQHHADHSPKHPVSQCVDYTSKQRAFQHSATIRAPYVISQKEWVPKERQAVKLVKEIIMNEFWRRTLEEQGVSQLQSTLVFCHHIYAEENANRFAALSSETSAPGVGGLQQQIEQLQSQLSGMQRQLQNQERPGPSSYRGRPRFQDQRPRQVWVPRRELQNDNYRGHAPIPPQRNYQQRQYYPAGRREFKPQWRDQNSFRGQSTSGQRGEQLPTDRRNVSGAPFRSAPRFTTPPITSRSRYAVINQQKRERRRRGREAMYRELQDIVLDHVQVRVRADGRIYTDNERVTLQVSPNLARNQRYNFLIDRLAPKPRRVDNSAVPVTREPTQVPLSIPHGSAQQVGGSSEIRDAQQITKPDDPTSLVNGTKDKLEERTKQTDAEMCGMVTVRHIQNSDSEWEPPHVSHEFTYSSDEEILPNPTPILLKNPTLLRRNRSVATQNCPKDRTVAFTEQKEAMATAPCLPVTSGSHRKPKVKGHSLSAPS